MSKDKVLLVAGDAALGERVSQMLRERGVPTDLVDPASDNTGPDALFDRAFDRQATAVLVVEPLPRYPGSPVDPSQPRSRHGGARRALLHHPQEVVFSIDPARGDPAFPRRGVTGTSQPRDGSSR